MINFLPLGGAGEIGANCYFLKYGNAGIVLDCGLHPQKSGIEALPDFNLIQDQPVDYVLISHAHQDHIDSLPFLVQRHPYIKVISTPQTRAIAELTLHNSISIMRGQINNDKLKIYSHDEVDLLIQSIEYRAYQEEFDLKGFSSKKNTKIKASFHDAGHILGSAGVLIECDEHRIFYTGDINTENQSLIPPAQLPKMKINTLILECTYGSTDSSSTNDWRAETERLTTSINRIISQGGSILIPVFALGKLQEMLAVISNQMTRGRIPQVDIYTGGLGRKISRIYDYNRYSVSRVDPEFELKNIPQKNLYEVDNPSDFFKNPCIVLASSGMMIEGTSSFRLAERWLNQHNSSIITVGYMDPLSPGYKVANARKGDKICLKESGELIEIKCHIENFRFSAHAKREGLIKIVEKLKPDNIILVHGEENAENWVGSSIISRFRGKRVFKPQIGEQINIE
ncbi:MAG: MBL fold metallo-hydrolase [Ignavibacteriaceae bacterium]|nr:MBL fold metallo-hydrolase [Ignavibacteriaceae bacterium]